MNNPKNLFLWVAIIAFFAVVILSFVSLGSPAQIRHEKYDQERITALKSLNSEIRAFAKREKHLPDSLDELNAYYISQWIRDPETGEKYEYRKINGYDYKICAEFGADYRPEERVVSRGNYGFSLFDIFGVAYRGKAEVRSYVDEEWYYEPGKWCFEKDASDVLPPLLPTHGEENIIDEIDMLLETVEN